MLLNMLLNMLLHMSLKKKLFIFITLPIVLSLSVLTVFYYFNTLGKTKKNLIHQIQSLLEVKQVSLENHLEHIARISGTIARYPQTASFLRYYDTTSDSRGIEDNPYYSQVHSVIHALQEENWGAIHHVFLVNREKKIILSPIHGKGTSSHLGQIVEHPALNDALAGKTLFTDFYGFSEKDHYHNLHMQPVTGPSGKVLGVVVVEITITEQVAILTSGINLSESDHMYMATLEGKQISHSKEGEMISFDPAIIDTVLEKKKMFAEYENHEGVKHNAVFLYDPRFPWILIMEFDQKEMLIGRTEEKSSLAKEEGATVIITLFIFAGSILAGVCFAFIISTGLSGSMRRISRGLSALSGQLWTTSRNISKSSKVLSRDSSKSAASIEEIETSIDDIAVKIKNSVTKTRTSAELIDTMANGIINIYNKIKDMQTAMQLISDSSNKILSINKVIDDIAFQTNILALNAAVEAARAGDAGRGFAVVADQVKQLAARSAGASRETSGLIEKALSSIKNGEVIVDQIMGFQEESNQISGKIGIVFSEIQGDSHNQLQVIKGLVSVIGKLSRSLQSNAAMSHDNETSAAALKEKADMVMETVVQLNKLFSGSASLNDGENRADKNRIRD